MATPYDKSTQIFSVHLPEAGRASSTLAASFPAVATGNRLLAEAGIATRGPLGGVRSGPHYLPGPRTLDRRPVPGRLASAIAANAAAVQQAGGVVDINTWAGSLQRAGVTEETIRAAYDAAGGNAVLAAQEAAGETSGFLGSFVQGLTELGVSPEVVVGTYQEAGGRLGEGSGLEKGTAGGIGTGSRDGEGAGGGGGQRGPTGVKHAIAEAARITKGLFRW